jgi:dihydroneopterin aldolase
VDRITLRDHVVEAEIGAYQGERGRRQRLRFGVAVELLPGGGGDDVDRIVSYDLLTDAVAEELAAERVNLLETLAERIAVRVLAPAAAVSARVTVEKLDLGPGALGVEIVRRRDEVHATAAAAVRPEVWYLGNAAVAAPRLGAWLDGLAPGAVLCVGAPEVPAPRAAEAAAQRRVELLAIGQNAWVLAGRDPRCGVRETRSELEWAAGRGELSVWAPAKLALDLPGAPAAEGPLLAAWLAEVLDARRLVYVDAEPPAGIAADRGTVG